MQNSPFPAHDQLISQSAQQPKGDPNSLLKFLFSTPEFLTAYQKDVIRAWMQDPAAGQAEMAQGPSGAKPAGAGGSPAGAAQPAGVATGGMPGAAQAPAQPAGQPMTPKPV